jgi:hypothetical protein
LYNIFIKNFVIFNKVIKLKIIYAGFLAFILIGCKKDVDTNPTVVSDYNYCHLYSTISADTSYIPHKKGNGWSYCSGNVNYAGYSAGVIRDTIIGNSIIFDRLFDTDSEHAFYSNLVYRTMIDSLGNYYQMTDQSFFSDTLLLIKPNAFNGDTIYHNPITHFKVVLVNNNETIETIPNCYHSVVISPNYGPRNYYFKKGIGELFFSGFKLNGARIN